MNARQNKRARLCIRLHVRYFPSISNDGNVALENDIYLIRRLFSSTIYIYLHCDTQTGLIIYADLSNGVRGKSRCMNGMVVMRETGSQRFYLSAINALAIKLMVSTRDLLDRVANLSGIPRGNTFFTVVEFSNLTRSRNPFELYEKSRNSVIPAPSFSFSLSFAPSLSFMIPEK